MKVSDAFFKAFIVFWAIAAVCSVIYFGWRMRRGELVGDLKCPAAVGRIVGGHMRLIVRRVAEGKKPSIEFQTRGFLSIQTRLLVAEESIMLAELLEQAASEGT